jgi:hypothetical protein
MNGSKAQCSTSEALTPQRVSPEEQIEDDGFITHIATKWVPPGATAPEAADASADATERDMDDLAPC